MKANELSNSMKFYFSVAKTKPMEKRIEIMEKIIPWLINRYEIKYNELTIITGHKGDDMEMNKETILFEFNLNDYCQCAPDDTTGWTKFDMQTPCCNICGKEVKNL